MAAPGGPDEETWRKMSPLARKIYWIFIATILGIILYLYLQ